jgi:hypothetical protein
MHANMLRQIMMASFNSKVSRYRQSRKKGTNKEKTNEQTDTHFKKVKNEVCVPRAVHISTVISEITACHKPS